MDQKSTTNTLKLAFALGLMYGSACSLECSIPYQAIGDECYYFSFPATANGFIAAQESCEQIEGTLAVLDTKDKAANVSEYVNKYVENGYHYIGGYSVGHPPDQYFWIGIGQPFKYSDWLETVNLNGSSCVGLSPYWNGQWDVLNCMGTYNYICQKVNNSCYDSSIETSCSDGYELANGKCYSFVTYETLQWIEAKEFCERRGAVLAILDSEQANQGVTDVITEKYSSSNFWIGLYDQSHEGRWVWDGKGTTTSYSNWYTGHPYQETNQNCALIQNNYLHAWVDMGCGNTYNFVCQKLPEDCGVDIVPDICTRTAKISTTTEIMETTTEESETCDPPFVLLVGGCFYGQQSSGTWKNAVYICEQMGATIGYILNNKERVALLNYLPTVPHGVVWCNNWLGLNDMTDPGTWVWEGINQTATYTAWGEGYPDMLNGYPCAWMNICTGYTDPDVDYGHWANSADCGTINYGIICRKY